MTTITIDLPEDVASDLRAKAANHHMSLEAFVQESVSHFILSDESGLEPISLMPEEIVALERAKEDLAAGRTFTHEEVMHQIRKSRGG
jgi:plasmid stability protein